MKREKNSKTKESEKEIIVMKAEQLLENLIDDYTTSQQKEIINLRRGIITKEEFMKNAGLYIDTYYSIQPEEKEKALQLLESYIFGYYKIEKHLEDKEISDIRILAHDKIRIKKLGKRMNSDVKFASEEEYRHFVDFAATKNQANIANVNALPTFTDIKSNPDFALRFTICMPIVTTTERPYVHIRKIPRDFPELPELIQMGMMPKEIAACLQERFAQHSTYICGKGGAGKTYLLNALKETIPEDRDCIVIQESEELMEKHHPGMIFLHSINSGIESKVQYTLKELSIAALKMDIDHFIIGEVKGAEAQYLLNASYTGHICATTGHGPDSKTGINKLVDYAMYESSYTREELLKMMLTFKTVVFLEDFKVKEISEAVDFDEKKKQILYKKIL